MTPGHAPNMAAAQFNHPHHQKRGPPQQSNSVPSTPHQQPRDLRFHSRSPSPSKTLGHSSPRSEAVGATSAPPRTAQPQFCKFETGAEYRKRRIIYTEGGNDPLPPPTEEPKAALEPDEDGKLSGDMRELYDRLLPSDESEQRKANLVKKLEDILNGEWPGSEIRVNVFGSSGNLLSSSDSDVDVCITTPLKKLESMHTLAAVLHKHGMDKVVCRASAKVPIVKIWDPELQLACDLNVNNPLALENTRMIKTYVQIDDRVRPLAKIIKYWTKQRILNDAAFGGTISSYTWICMIINFLQVRSPPILPSLQKMPNARSTNSSFADNLDELRGFGTENKETLGQLLFHFFRHYGYVFDYAEYVVSVKEGRLLPRKEKGWDVNNYLDKEARSRLCVEEPFNILRNLGNSADDYAFTGIHKEIRRAFELIRNGSDLGVCCEQYEFPPEEKPIFQRPPPKPKPILTRSASQSGRPNAGSAQGRGNANGPRNNRNPSNQRNSNRRSSSGANYGNQRLPYVMSPPVGINPADYFSASGMSTDQLHNQLYKQYQLLQAQQEALRNQLIQQQQTQAAQLHVQVQAQAQAQARGVEMTTSPRTRHLASTVPSPHSPRTFDNAPNTAPLLPGYLYHYPARYPPPSPLSQSRNTEDSITSPSSPSLQNATPSLRRGIHRSSVTEGSSSASARSQSQPGRSFPNPLTLQGLVHPGYDVSGAIAAPYLVPRVQHFSQGQSNGSVRQPNSSFPPETAMPKEYVGYYVGQSPQLLPQYPAASIAQIPQLRDIPLRTDRRISPELISPGMQNGIHHQSRSPSPPGANRRHSSSVSAQPFIIPQTGFQQTPPQPKPVEIQGPVIVNGSNPVIPKSRQPSTVASTPHPAQAGDLVNMDVSANMVPTEQIQQMSLDGSYPIANGSVQHHDLSKSLTGTDGLANGHTIDYAPPMQNVPAPTWQSPGDSRDHTTGGAGLSPHPVSQAQGLPYGDESSHGARIRLDEPTQSVPGHATGPLLSPVVETRTPSPTANAFRFGPHHNLAQNVQIANGRTAEALESTAASRNRKNSSSSNSARNDGKYQAPTGNPSGNSWQQAPSRKGHKKSKSTVVKGPHASKAGGGEPLPANEADRKGG